MRRLYKENKKTIWIMLAAVAVCVGCCAVMVFSLLNRLEQQVYQDTAILLGEVKEQYPDFDEMEWISHLNARENSETGAIILEQYGIFYDGANSLLGREKREILLWIIGGMTFLSLILVAVWLRTQRRRQNRLDRLTRYVRKLEQGEYLLDIPESREDELDALRKELYNVTVLFRENAEISKNQRKALADSVSDISHQLKTPLTSATVLLDNLLDNEQMEEATRRKFLMEISRQINNMSWLIASLLKLSRLDAGVVEFEKEKVEVDKLLTQVAENLEIMTEFKNISINKTGVSDATLEGDFYWLKEAFTNIVKNAIEHSPQESQILLSVEDNAVYTAIAVKDFGEGMTEEQQRHIFERFYRSPYAGENNVGIGLSLAKEIITRQNGSIQVSSAPDKGTIFTMKFSKV